MNTNSRRMCALIGAAALSLSACGSSSDSGGGGGDAKVLRIAGLMPLTGAVADTYGSSMIAGVEYVFDQVNDDGGVEINGDKYKIDFQVFDDQCAAEPSQAAAQKALDEDYEFFLGPICSGAASAVQPTMARSKAFFGLAPTTVAGPTQLPNVFRTFPLTSAYTDATVQWLDDHPEIGKIAMITDQNHTGLVGEEPRLVEQLKKDGREVVAEQQYQTADTDFRAPVTEAIAAAPDLYMQRSYPAAAAQLLQQTRELGGQMAVMWNAGVTNDEVRSLVPDEKMMANVYQAAPLFSLDAFLADGSTMAQEVADGVGDKAGSFTAAGHDLAALVVEALSHAEEATPEALIDAMTNLKASEVEGKTLNTYTAQDKGLVFKDREVDVPAAVVEWKQGTGWVMSE
jgi:branched-chain amino acid transport system substrate-binding protein